MCLLEIQNISVETLARHQITQFVSSLSNFKRSFVIQRTIKMWTFIRVDECAYLERFNGCDSEELKLSVDASGKYIPSQKAKLSLQTESRY